jgi:hypothetical protein
LFCPFTEIVIDRVMHILVSPGARDDALDIHRLPRCRTRLRRPSK